MAGGKAKEGDALKMYTIAMMFLVIVMGVLYFVIDGKRKKFEAANVIVERMMTSPPRRPGDDNKPRSFQQLAIAVERLANDYQEATGGEGVDRGHISTAFMEQVATNAGLKGLRFGRERSTPGGGGSYETVTMRIDYESMAGGAPTVWQLLRLMFLIETRRLYRVSEMQWQMVDAAENPDPPYDRIKNPQVEVALRYPTVEDE